MGGWNGTCNISKLPIFHGDDIVVIPLVAVSDDLSTSTCYPTDNFVPFAMPIFGKYNDYGGIEDSTITPENDVLIRSYEFYEKAVMQNLTKSKLVTVSKSSYRKTCVIVLFS